MLCSRPVSFSIIPGLGHLGLKLCTKSMGLSFLCLVLMSAPLVSDPTLKFMYAITFARVLHFAYMLPIYVPIYYSHCSARAQLYIII